MKNNDFSAVPYAANVTRWIGREEAMNSLPMVAGVNWRNKKEGVYDKNPRNSISLHKFLNQKIL
jgi:hypothetical protein